ncbi:MAG: NADPH:quinone reductase-like Zn-dependent oxidoreductase [Verrucomicrobiales bacterium]|jgi:NADPH:quinone reductase-like Zn-dependent oxidoreductase
MQAIVQDRFGSADVLKLETIERPTISDHEVLIEVHAAGVDRGTEHLMNGLPYLIRLAGYGFTKPKSRVPGLDVAGVVVEVGTAVTRFSLGDEVFGISNGSFAQYAAATEDKLALKPANLNFEQAAVAAVSGGTALQALTDVGDVKPGQRVLVIGASGGVGTYAVQLAKALGAEVTGVASTAKLDLVRSLGPDHVIDYTQTDFADGSERYDLVLDIGGRTSVRRLRSVLTKKGTLVIVGGEDGNRITGGIGRQVLAMALSPFVSQRLTTFIGSESYKLMERLATFMTSGQLVPVIGQRFELEELAEAMRKLEAGRATGKTAIIVRQPDQDRS